MTIHRELERAGMSHKKLKRITQERNEDCQAAFVIEMAQYTSDQIGFIDETSKDRRTPSQGYGRLRKGRQVSQKQEFVHGRRISTEALLTLDGMVSGTAVEGSTTRAIFLDWLEFSMVSVQIHLLSLCSHISKAAKMLCISRSIECASDGQCINSPWRGSRRAL